MQMICDVQKIREILPHRYPLLLVDRITTITPNQSIEGYKNEMCKYRQQ